MTGGPLRLVLQASSDPDHVAVVRAAVSGMSQVAGIDPRALADLQTAISEACNNVVLRAYGDQVGPMRVAVEINAELVEVVVTDQGYGFPGISSEPSSGLGVALIGALADDVEFHSPDGIGTEVRMQFHTETGLGDLGGGDDWPPVASTFAPDQISLWLSPVAQLGRVLARVVALLTASAQFSLRAVENARTAAALLARYVELDSPSAVEVTLSVHSHGLSFMVPDGTVSERAKQPSDSQRARNTAREQTLSELVAAVSSCVEDAIGDRRFLHVELRGEPAG